jgi:hypothetical protein
MWLTLLYAFKRSFNGRYGFVLPPNQIIPSGEEMWAGFEVVIKKIIEVSKA